ncbi:hypothetical protein CN326_02825 [Bacillus sp. AFS018417]|nr:hypothetical protein CN326_02825 [Bacillus sp. AFS018417]
MWTVRDPYLKVQRKVKKIGGGITVRKSSIGKRFPSVGRKKTPTDGSFTLFNTQNKKARHMPSFFIIC